MVPFVEEILNPALIFSRILSIDMSSKVLSIKNQPIESYTQTEHVLNVKKNQ